MIYTTPDAYSKQRALWVQAAQRMRDKAASTGSSTDSSAGSSPLRDMTEQIQAISGQNKLSAIMTKMKTGKRLSSAEKEYLKQNAPDTYQKYCMIEAEREGHRKQLKGAKTREAAERIHQTKLVALSRELDATKASSDSEYVLCRAAAVNEEYREYKAKCQKQHSDTTVEA